MKIKLSQKVKQMASALLVVMVLGGILCLFVIYYLSLVEQQNKLSVRSQAWNMAIAVTEAGIEEGLQALNSNSGVPLASDGWAANGTVYGLSRTNLDGNWYTVSLDLATPKTPVLIARSYINLPVLACAPSLTMFAVVGNGTTAPTSSTSSTLVSRAVRVTCEKNPSSLFTAAMVSKHAIDMKGNGVATDSYNSSDPTKSTNGKYDKNKYQGDHGDVATNDGIIVGVGNANIYGILHTGPNGGYSLGPNGGVGEHAWQAQAANRGCVETNYFLQDANFTFPDTSIPTNTATYLSPKESLDLVVPYTTVSTYPNPVPAGLVTNTFGNGNNATYTYTYPDLTATLPYPANTVPRTNHYDNVLHADHNYITTNLTGNTLVVGNNVRLVLPKGLTGAENLFFDYTTADTTIPGLTIYAGGTSAAISGNQYINPSGFAGSLLIYCAPTVTSFTLNGNGQFTGVLVAPNANLAMNGGGSSDEDFSGSLMVNNVSLNGHFNFHWDEALAKLNAPIDARYLVKSWNEIH